MSFMISNNEDTFCFFEVEVANDGVPELKFAFGTADPMEMDFEDLGKMIAVAKRNTISIHQMDCENDGNYETLIDGFTITHTDNIFDLESKTVDFDKYKL